MTRRLAGCLAATLACGCASATAERATGSDVDGEPDRPRLEQFVPAGVEAVVFVDYARLRAQGFAGLFTDGDDDARARGRQARGFSDAEDVDRALTITFPGPDGASIDAYEGRFVRGDVESAFTRRHGEITAGRWRDRPIVAGASAAASLPEDGVLIMGPLAPVRSALDCRARIGRCLSDDAWDREVRAALAKGWSTNVVPAFEVRARVGEAMRERLARELGDGDRLTWFGVRMGMNRGLSAVLVARAQNESEARDFAARLRGHMRELARRPLVAALELGDALDGLAVTVAGDVVIARLGLTEADWGRVERRLEIVARAVRQAREAEGEATP